MAVDVSGSVIHSLRSEIDNAKQLNIELREAIRTSMSVVEIEDGVYESTAVIDNGSFGTRTIRFETGRLAQQAAGSVVAYLDDETMLLSATTASKSPKDHFDFFPLTIDVEERMYAVGPVSYTHLTLPTNREV